MMGLAQRFSRTLAAVALGSALFGFQALAEAAIVFYDFGTDTSPTYAPSLVDPGVTAEPFTFGAGLGSTGNFPNTINGLYVEPSNNNAVFAMKPVANTQESAYTNNAYWAVSVTPKPGTELDLTSLTLRIVVFNTDRPISYYLSSNISGFDQPIADPVIAATTSADVSFDLSSASFQNLTQRVEFRLYVFAEESGASGSRWTFDNISLNGAAVPEPAAMCGALLAAASLMGRRRR